MNPPGRGFPLFQVLLGRSGKTGTLSAGRTRQPSSGGIWPTTAMIIHGHGSLMHQAVSKQAVETGSIFLYSVNFEHSWSPKTRSACLLPLTGSPWVLEKRGEKNPAEDSFDPSTSGYGPSSFRCTDSAHACKTARILHL